MTSPEGGQKPPQHKDDRPGHEREMAPGPQPDRPDDRGTDTPNG